MSGVEKRLGRHQVLSRVTFTTEGGSVLGLIGANGSGKTTLLRLLLGLIRPDSGCIRLYGIPLDQALGYRPTAYFAGGASVPPTVRVGTWARLLDPGVLPRQTDAASQCCREDSDSSSVYAASSALTIPPLSC